MNKCSETKADNNVIREKSWLQWNPRTEIDSAHEKEKLRLVHMHSKKGKVKILWSLVCCHFGVYVIFTFNYHILT